MIEKIKPLLEIQKLDIQISEIENSYKKLPEKISDINQIINIEEKKIQNLNQEVSELELASKGYEKNVLEIFKFLEKYNINKVLDVGCGELQYKKYIQCEEYIGIELEENINSENKIEENNGVNNGLDKNSRKPDIFFNGKNIPFKKIILI